MTSETSTKASSGKGTSFLSTRKIEYYLLLASLLADAYASKGASLMHLTLWSWVLHLLYFELDDLSTDKSLIRFLHGPSLTGSAALFGMYVWTLVANPNLEFDLAPEGRATWLIYARAFWLHVAPVLFHGLDLHQNAGLFREYIYKGQNSFLFQFWAAVGGYFAMGLTWEQVNGDATATYNVTLVSSETYVLVSKAIGVISCLLAFFLFVKPLMKK